MPSVFITLTTKRLQLRPLSDSDVDSIVKIHSDKDMSKMLSDSFPDPYTKDDHVTLGYWIGKAGWGEGLHRVAPVF